MNGYFCWLRALSPIARLIFKIQYEGTENIPPQGKLVVCCNHRSVIDPFLLAMPFRRQLFYMAKSELFTDHGPFAAWFLKMLGAFPVHRDRGGTEAMRAALEILENGGIVGVFPEGRCMFDGGVFKPKAGAALMAVKSGAPILPACIFCEGRLTRFRKHIVVRFGKEIPQSMFVPQENERAGARAAAELVAQRVNALLEEGY